MGRKLTVYGEDAEEIAYALERIKQMILEGYLSGKDPNWKIVATK